MNTFNILYLFGYLSIYPLLGIFVSVSLDLFLNCMSIRIFSSDQPSRVPQVLYEELTLALCKLLSIDLPPHNLSYLSLWKAN